MPIDNLFPVKIIILIFPVEDVKKRVTSLRTMFRRALQLPTGTAGDTLTPMQKELVKMCAFLRNHLRSLPTKSNLASLPKKKVNILYVINFLIFHKIYFIKLNCVHRNMYLLNALV